MHSSKIKLLALDLETTGLNSERDQIIEVGAFLYDCERDLKRYSSLVYFDGKLDDVVRNLTGIQEEELRQAPNWDVVRGQLIKLIAEADVIIGHNIQFDLQFLAKANVVVDDMKIWDTWYMASMLIGKEKSFALKALANYIGWEYQAHRALDDAVAVSALYKYLTRKCLREVSDQALDRILAKDSKKKWVYHLLFEQEKNYRFDNNLSVNKNCCISKELPARVDSMARIENGVGLVNMDLTETVEKWWSDETAKDLVISKKSWEFLKKKYSLRFVDEQHSYLCKQKLKEWLSSIDSNNENEFGIYAKIILQTDRGCWDGYLSEINWSKEEWKSVNNLSCGDIRLNHDECFYSYLNKISSKRVLTQKYWSRSDKKSSRIYFWLESLLLEDGLTEIAEERLDSENMNISEWSDCLKCDERVTTKQTREYLDEFESMLTMWRGLIGLMVKAKGIEYENEQILYFTPSTYNDLVYQNCRNFAKKVEEKCWQMMQLNIWCVEHQKILYKISKFANLMNQSNEKLAVAVKWSKYDNELHMLMMMVDLDILIEKITTENDQVLICGKWSHKINYLKKVGLLDKKKEIGYSVNHVQPIIEYTKDELGWIESNKKQLMIFGNRFKMQSWLQKYKNNIVAGNVRVSNQDNDDGKYSLRVCTYYDLAEMIMKGWKFEKICLESIPFDPPEIFVQNCRELYFGDDAFPNYKIPRMLNKIIAINGLLFDGGRIFTLDQRFILKKYNILLAKL